MRSLIVGMSVAVVAATVHAVSYTWPADTSGGLRFEGGSYEVSQTTGDMVNNGGAIVVTNATLNAWNADGDDVNFLNESGGTTTLDKGGTFRVYSLKSDGILNLNPGSRLELEKFIYSKSATGRINADGGLIVFRNVSKPSPYYWFPNYDSYAAGWVVNVMEGGLVISNAVSGDPRGYMPPIKSGASTDGGVTYKGVGTIYATENVNNNFNGGVTIAGGLTLAVKSDKSFGALPATPTDNIFWKANGTLYGNTSNFEINRNRNIVISPGVQMAGGSSSSLRILGTIRSEVDGDETTIIKANQSWNGSLVLSPGAGRTNQVGRLKAAARLVIESGTTVVCNTAGDSTKPTESIVGILREDSSNPTSYNDNKGILEVKGGELRCEGSGYVPIKNYGQLIVSGGVCDFNVPGHSSHEVLNGFVTPGRTIVKNGGELRCWTFRLSQNSTIVNGDIPTQLHLVTGGVVRCREFTVGGNSVACRIDFDGGGVRAIAGVGDFLGKSSAEWPNVPVYVHEGGAVFDSNGYNIGVHLPLQSAAANDGGLTKKGDGRLTLSKANTYNGPTRVLGGNVLFQNAAGFPGGDIEIDAEELVSRGANSPFVSSSTSLTFGSGSKLRILVPAGFDLTRLSANRAVVQTSSAMLGDLPTAVAVDADTGEELPTTTHVMRCSFNATRGTLYVRSYRRGSIIMVL